MSSFDEKELRKEDMPELKVTKEPEQALNSEPIHVSAGPVAGESGQANSSSTQIAATVGIKERATRASARKKQVESATASDSLSELVKPFMVLAMLLFLPWLFCGMSPDWSGPERQRLNNFINKELTQNHFEKAEQFGFQAIKRLDEAPPNDPSVPDRKAYSYSRLGDTYRLMGQGTRSAEYYRKAAECAVDANDKLTYLLTSARACALFDPAHAESALKERWKLLNSGNEAKYFNQSWKIWTQLDLSRVLTLEGKFDEAAAAARKASYLAVQDQNGWYPTIASVLLADALAGAGQHASAAKAYSEAQNVPRGTDNPEYANSLHGLAMDRLNGMKFADALSDLDMALKSIEKLSTTYMPDNLYSRSDLLNDKALIYIASHQFSQAISILAGVIAEDEKLNGGKNLALARDLVNLASAQAGLGEKGSAKQSLAKALAIRNAILGANNALTRQASQLLGNLK